MKFVGIVTARKGSKTIKNKNILQLKKKKLIEYTFSEIKKSKLRDNAYVVTDDKRVKKLATKYKINIDYIRPSSLSTDKSSSIDTIYHFYKWLLKREDFDVLVLLQPTSPLRSFKDINKSLEIFKKNKFDSLFSISESLEHPYETINLKNKRKIFYNFNKSKKFHRRQDFDVNSYFINGAIYIFKKELIKYKKIYSKNNHGFYIMPKIRSLDLNDLEDVAIVKKIIK